MLASGQCLARSQPPVPASRLLSVVYLLARDGEAFYLDSGTVPRVGPLYLEPRHSFRLLCPFHLRLTRAGAALFAPLCRHCCTREYRASGACESAVPNDRSLLHNREVGKPLAIRSCVLDSRLRNCEWQLPVNWSDWSDRYTDISGWRKDSRSNGRMRDVASIAGVLLARTMSSYLRWDYKKIYLTENHRKPLSRLHCPGGASDTLKIPDDAFDWPQFS